MLDDVAAGVWGAARGARRPRPRLAVEHPGWESDPGGVSPGLALAFPNPHERPEEDNREHETRSTCLADRRPWRGAARRRAIGAAERLHATVRGRPRGAHSAGVCPDRQSGHAPLAAIRGAAVRVEAGTPDAGKRRRACHQLFPVGGTVASGARGISGATGAARCSGAGAPPQNRLVDFWWTRSKRGMTAKFQSSSSTLSARTPTKAWREMFIEVAQAAADDCLSGKPGAAAKAVLPPLPQKSPAP